LFKQHPATPVPEQARPQACKRLMLTTQVQQLAGDAATRFSLSGRGAAQPSISRIIISGANAVN
jgi:hypothetical protein